MCGICAVVDVAPAGVRWTIERMTDTLRHRGPDDRGVWLTPKGSVALGHRRLGGLDASGHGRQPMSLRQRRAWITYNGEIYNFQALRAELVKDGYTFQSHTDTEVVLAAYDRWGVECLERFDGMFAFVLWDAVRDRVLLARDRLGRKPLYYAQYGQRFTAASELKGIASDPAFPREVDTAALGLFLRYGYVPSPLTIYRHASKVPAGHYAVFEGGKVAVHRYWDPLALAGAASAVVDSAAAERELESLLRAAVKQRMTFDVAPGAFLSGSVDSSLVAALMQEQSRRRIKTFTIRFDEDPRREAQARLVADHLNTDHEEHRCSLHDVLGIVDALPEMFDEPFADPSAISTFLVSGMARAEVEAVLSGDGGDELFLRHPRYWQGSGRALPHAFRELAAAGARYLPTRRLRQLSDALEEEEQDRDARLLTWWKPTQILGMTGEWPEDVPFFAEARARAGERQDMPGVLDLIAYLPDDVLTKVDRASMAVGLEVRTPLLDRRVVEFTLRLPVSLKRRGSTTKRLMRRLLTKRMPRDMRKLVEQPAASGPLPPLLDWFRGPLRESMQEYCAGDALPAVGVDPAVARKLWADFQSGRSRRVDLLWQLYVLAAWSRRFHPVSVSA